MMSQTMMNQTRTATWIKFKIIMWKEARTKKANKRQCTRYDPIYIKLQKIKLAYNFLKMNGCVGGLPMCVERQEREL